MRGLSLVESRVGVSFVCGGLARPSWLEGFEVRPRRNGGSLGLQFFGVYSLAVWTFGRMSPVAFFGAPHLCEVIVPRLEGSGLRDLYPSRSSFVERTRPGPARV